MHLHLFAFLRLLSPLLAAAGILMAAAAPPSAVAPAATDIVFKSLQYFELQEKLLELQRSLSDEQTKRAQTKRDFGEVLDLIRSASQQRTHDDQILGYIGAARQVQALLRGAVRGNSDRQRGTLTRLVAETKVLLNKAYGEEKPDQKITDYLGQAEVQIQESSRSDALLRQRLRALLGNIDNRIRNVPPPPAFRNASGQMMVYVDAGAESFYLSAAPVSRTLFETFLAEFQKSAPQAPAPAGTHPAATPGSEALHPTPAAVSWDMATAFCKWLSARERHPYALPTAAQLEAAGPQTPCALWTRTEWRGPEPRSVETRQRFGGSMYQIWAPDTSLNPGGAEPAELPFAEYPNLGFSIVTAPETGHRTRWERLTKLK